MRADVELDTAEYGWVTLPAALSPATRHPRCSGSRSRRRSSRSRSCRPGRTRPRRSRRPTRATPWRAARTGRLRRHGFAIPAIVITVATDAGIPVLAVAGLAGALVAAKALRRRRRRSFGPPATRVAGAWRELVDLSRDLGIVAASPDAAVKPGMPRAPGVRPRPRSARRPAGSSPRTPRAAACRPRRTWRSPPTRPPSARPTRTARRRPGSGPLVATARRGATASLPRWRRAWVAVNPASLWASRAAVDRAVVRPRRAVRSSGGGRGAGGGRGSHGARSQRRRRAIPGGAYR